MPAAAMAVRVRVQSQRQECKQPTSLKNTVASWPYRGDLKAKSMLKVSQQLLAVGPASNSHLLSSSLNSVLSATCAPRRRPSAGGPDIWQVLVLQVVKHESLLSAISKHVLPRSSLMCR